MKIYGIFPSGSSTPITKSGKSDKTQSFSDNLAQSVSVVDLQKKALDVLPLTKSSDELESIASRLNSSGVKSSLELSKAINSYLGNLKQ
ncbi:hypothetical protein Thena_1693 [Thermodesulfobium narugense DSM 14796]|uniref:Uncharacterized protein n=1 Tax=Thermodesulfobium narugense DSM 14796 TaxID=747365 RepID=M1E8R2_9BACT|nr:hypothetical protein [Thermodesulfobium narugense]AEE15303.1 hypothetical protein Thena_1693 [Thermodesulfobium narugense DSM 14796]